MAQLSPYLNFDNKCREAMTFYQSCFGGDLMMQTVGEMPEMAAQMPPEFKDSIMHASLTVSPAMILLASDLNRSQRIEGNTMNLCINCKTEEELSTYFEKLADGGSVIHPINDMPWGALYAELKDKYNVCWLLNYQKAGGASL